LLKISFSISSKEFVLTFPTLSSLAKMQGMISPVAVIANLPFQQEL